MSLKLNKALIKWFTLIEMLIVIAIIGVILWMTIYMWSNDILRLKNKTIKEDFVETFSSFYNNSIWSNYYNNQRFSQLNLDLISWANSLYFTYIWENAQYSWNKTINNEFSISKIKLLSWNNFQENDKATIQIYPYKFGCEIYDNINLYSTQIEFEIKIKTEKYCFNVWSDNCKLQEILCQN